MTHYANRQAIDNAINSRGNKLRPKEGLEKGTLESLRSEQQTYRDDYATIVEFLNNRENFMASLAAVSRLLWAEYLQGTYATNRFTRALSIVAENKGFKVHNRLNATVGSSVPMRFKLVGGDPGLGFFLKNKLFWKDCMDTKHGEHTHSLQWLAIAHAGLDTQKTITDLYANSGNFIMTTSSAKKSGVCYAWNWVADCFPTWMAGDGMEIDGTGDDLLTDSCRSPQYIMQQILPAGKAIPEHFVSEYLYRRYYRRGAFAKHAEKIGGNVADHTRTEAGKQNAIWQLSTNGGGNRFMRTYNPALNRHQQANSTKNLDHVQVEECTFHGIKGELAMGQPGQVWNSGG